MALMDSPSSCTHLVEQVLHFLGQRAPVEFGRACGKTQYEISLDQPAANLAKALAGQTANEISINRTPQQTFRDDQPQSRPGLFALCLRPVMQQEMPAFDCFPKTKNG